MKRHSGPKADGNPIWFFFFNLKPLRPFTPFPCLAFFTQRGFLLQERSTQAGTQFPHCQQDRCTMQLCCHDFPLPRSCPSPPQRLPGPLLLQLLSLLLSQKHATDCPFSWKRILSVLVGLFLSPYRNLHLPPILNPISLLIPHFLLAVFINLFVLTLIWTKESPLLWSV